MEARRDPLGRSDEKTEMEWNGNGNGDGNRNGNGSSTRTPKVVGRTRRLKWNGMEWNPDPPHPPCSLAAHPRLVSPRLALSLSPVGVIFSAPQQTYGGAYSWWRRASFPSRCRLVAPPTDRRRAAEWNGMEWSRVEWSGMEWKLNETPKVGMWSRRRRAWGGAAAFATSTTRDDVT